MVFISTIHDPDTLVPRATPVVEEAFHQKWILELDVVNMAVFLEITNEWSVWSLDISGKAAEVVRMLLEKFHQPLY